MSKIIVGSAREISKLYKILYKRCIKNRGELYPLYLNKPLFNDKRRYALIIEDGYFYVTREARASSWLNNAVKITVFYMFDEKEMELMQFSCMEFEALVHVSGNVYQVRYSKQPLIEYASVKALGSSLEEEMIHDGECFVKSMRRPRHIRAFIAAFAAASTFASTKESQVCKGVAMLKRSVMYRHATYRRKGS